MKQGIYIILVLLALSFSACRNRSVSRPKPETDTTVIYALIDSGNVLFDNAKYEESLELGKEALALAREVPDTDVISDALSLVLCDYQQLGLLDSAIVAAKELLAIDLQVGDEWIWASDYSNIAYIYVASKQYNLAIEFIEKAIEYEKSCEGQPKLSIRYGIAAEAYNQLANSHTRKDSTALREKALDYINMAYDLDMAHQDSLHAARRLSVRGDVLCKLQRLSEAEQAYKQAQAILERYGEQHSLGITYRQLGNLYLSEKKPNEAIPYLEKAKDMARSDNELVTLEKDYEKLYKAYQTIDEKKSNEYLKLYSETKDSVYTLESANKLSEFHAKYDTEKEKEKAESKHRQLIGTWIIGSIAFVFALVGIVALHRRKNQHIRQLREQILQLKQQMEQQQQQFLEAMKREEEAETPEMDERDSAFLESVNKVVFDIIGHQEPTVENIASVLCITSQQLRRKIKAIKDVTAISYINSIRMQYAKQLLLERHDLSIVQVGQLCGFYEPTNFTRSFKKETGQTPSQFRETPSGTV